MAPLSLLEPAGLTAEVSRLAEKIEGLRLGRKPLTPPVRALNVITKFFPEDDDQHEAIKIKLPPEWDSKTISEAIVAPFVAAYDEKHPDVPASALGPFTRVKVLVWSGPTPNAADKFRDPYRDGIEDIEEAQKPIWCLCDVGERIGLLRMRGYNLLKPTVTVGARPFHPAHARGAQHAR